MKKSLFLLPLLGGFVLSGCTITIGNKTFKLFEKDKQEETKKEEESSEKGSGNGGQQNQGGGSSVSGTLLATVNLTGFADAVDKDANPLVYSNNSYTVTIEEGSASTGLDQAVANSKTYEFRVYKGMNIVFAGPQAFSKLLVKFSTYVSNGTSYYFDLDLDGATNECDESKGEAVVTLNSAATSYTVENVGHQTRIASVAFYA